MSQMQTVPSAGVRVSPVRRLVITAILGAMSAVLMSLQIPVPFAPPFLQLDFAEVPVLIGGFLLGPASAVQIIVIKILLKLVIRGTETAFLGEVLNLVGSIVLVLPAAFIYRKLKSYKGAVIGVVVSIALHLVWAGFCNVYISLPMYARIYGWPIESLIAMGTAVNANITDMRSFVLLAIIPFNILKNTIVGIITICLMRGGQLLRHFR